MIWKIKEADKDLVKNLSRELNISEILSRLLINRGITTKNKAEKFLHPSFNDLANPFLLAGMEKAVERIKAAKEKGEKILIYGDYDVDGVTSIALLLSFFRELGLKSLFYIPNRLTEGYGLNKEALKLAHAQKVSLIITVDCGITNSEEILFAKSLGIDIIITDHHLPEEGKRIESLVTIDPMVGECPEELKYLAGVGVAYKLIQALKGNSATGGDLSQHLDLVALGTIADLVPLTGENRILVTEGLKQIKESKKEGIKALLRVSKLTDQEINPHHVGFLLGPRLNAAGRVASAKESVELLSTKSYEKANTIAKKLDKQNQERQEIQKDMFKEACDLIKKEKLDSSYSIVLIKEGWHPGVAGIVASKVVEKFYRPTIVLGLEKGIAKGSGRSIENFHLFSAIKRCKDLLLSCGGHKLAIGLTLKKEKIPQFKKRLEEEARRSISEDDFKKKISIDSLLSLQEITPSFLDDLKGLAPFGRGNPRPVFASRNLIVGNFLRKNPEHLFCWLKEGCHPVDGMGKGTYLEAAGFGMAKTVDLSPGEVVDAAYYPNINDWQGIKRIQLNLKDIKNSGHCESKV
ncbi:MAG: single-stranded-DNA-specific exonuclease RecJ [bacterium (Candidatus Ratteibacteria) CG_4_10_14_3_um_filter_41_18]|uniref:Single-stranded-DNA-specific exonuclease RecJ n=3 Tax=Candidatus Ratteibacteria TaxID=2979319 RepID=A0A2M7E6Z7_9BACT|nr:MAG: single-stranded-DNA-specific exonuclease RecJ [Candidatus Omnitrophica bacterium CG1_02_41_171]PIV63494.1 MAG: single-stranded-DNA-specific exonuclease RecJ [bacterium (Candidatus Ratteibacteria) CG01_land_8_20_14_3_00_40_19]PIW33622.1 MAG: single-stranded-DNA-specific exonuclease RecJ [bacterium (Candidatus Ratteibacteria) CG15_BIG_FIL_POST_REV_8_21_14_020_41_12]PIX77055.1 MAG: single-stranded-DNA-specific exonuclease RecJ [bacterium (Candidatus Ratteibacteria) CG_4_10_14_3_um_filter_41